MAFSPLPQWKLQVTNIYFLVKFIVLVSLDKVVLVSLSKEEAVSLRRPQNMLLCCGISSILVWGQKAKQLLLCTKLLIHQSHNNRNFSLLPGLLGGPLWALPSGPWGQYTQQTMGTSRWKGFIVEKKFLALEPSCSSHTLQTNLCSFPEEIKVKFW